jgi:hypothetical protein
VSGSWDVPSLSFDSAFQINVMGFPLPDAKSPKYGPFYDGAYSEAETQTGFGFSIAQGSKHPELALDLLRFLTSLKANEALNRDIQWIPVIRGADATELLKGFVPRVEGTFNPELYSLLDGGRFFLLRSQLFWPYISGQSTYEQYAQQLEDGYASRAAIDLRTQLETNERGVINGFFSRAMLEARALSRSDAAAAAEDRRRATVVRETLFHGMKDGLLARMKFLELFRDTRNAKAQEFRRALNPDEVPDYAP